MKRVINFIEGIIMVLFVFLSTGYIHNIENITNSNNQNNTINLSTMALKVEEFKEKDIYSVKDTFTGDLTAYGYDCALCGGTLGCKPGYYIQDGTIHYPDATYGKVRIVASSMNLPCGSIVRFNSKRVSDEPVIAIVLDRGVRGNALDLLVGQEKDAPQIGRSVITYDVLREGWGK